MDLTEGGSHTKVVIGDHADVVARHGEINESQITAKIDHPQAGGTIMRVTATATRAGQWWAIEVPEVAGGLHTQARRLDQVGAAVADAVALAADIPADSIEVDISTKLPQGDAELIDAVRAASREATIAAERASRLSRQAVEQLRSQGMTVRDVGGLLGVSAQRVSQLGEASAVSS